ncbi:MAG: Gfo/Idh/MocA family protein [Nitrospira sp.]
MAQFKASLRKIIRYVQIYGPSRALFKAVGRKRIGLPLMLPRGRACVPDIGLIGCGQFAFATIGYYLREARDRRLGACFDIKPEASRSLASALRVPKICASADELLTMPGLRLVYIASNHSSHAPYAAKALLRGLDVYVEKPIAVEMTQLVEMLGAKRASGRAVYAGYNRPFSAAIRDLRAVLPIRQESGFSIHCFVAGHQIGSEHWYRLPSEGTRVCGNLGHWLDLMVHILAWRGLPDQVQIVLSSADPKEPDDNFVVTIATDRNDIFSVMLSSRSEPFEGIYESIHVQHGDVTCHIDDFRRMTIHNGPQIIKRRYWPKDVGHRAAILQPFNQHPSREWREVELSTLVMLHVADMVRRREVVTQFSLKDAGRSLDEWVEVCSTRYLRDRRSSAPAC